MGALSNNARKLANFTGFYKGIQSAGGAIAPAAMARVAEEISSLRLLARYALLTVGFIGSSMATAGW